MKKLERCRDKSKRCFRLKNNCKSKKRRKRKNKNSRRSRRLRKRYVNWLTNR